MRLSWPLTGRTRELQAIEAAISASAVSGILVCGICLSVKDAVLHGKPHDYVLRDGDVLSLDVAVSIDGWVADSAVTVIVGDPLYSGELAITPRDGIGALTLLECDYRGR